MEFRLKTYNQTSVEPEIYKMVSEIGNNLFNYCNLDDTKRRFEKANFPRNSSAVVQEVFLDMAIELGLKSEKKGLFENIPTSNLRPDYYCNIGDSGIIIEVERGKTIMNNMDMLDMWKCHICQSAHHLFLFVPNKLKQNPEDKPYDCFTKVSDRMAPFFNSNNYTNVHSLWLFGY